VTALRAAVVVFPGSNCDRDAAHALEDVTGARVDLAWHGDELDPAAYDLVVLPGGFSYGDHLRCGAIAKTAVAMRGVREAAARGALVLGICNGFQVLCEAGLLPGALVRNDSLQFRCEQVELEVVNAATPFTGGYLPGERLTLPIAHGEGCFVADAETLAALEAGGQVAFRYAGANPNGSMAAIAGITNAAGNVLGMMPHPERAVDELLGGRDGAALFTSIAEAARAHAHA
jgi:phosphoribosylformylglycinamidine synthase I